MTSSSAPIASSVTALLSLLLPLPLPLRLELLPWFLPLLPLLLLPRLLPPLLPLLVLASLCIGSWAATTGSPDINCRGSQSASEGPARWESTSSGASWGSYMRMT